MCHGDHVVSGEGHFSRRGGPVDSDDQLRSNTSFGELAWGARDPIQTDLRRRRSSQFVAPEVVGSKLDSIDASVREGKREN